MVRGHRHSHRIYRSFSRLSASLWRSARMFGFSFPHFRSKLIAFLRTSVASAVILTKVWSAILHAMGNTDSKAGFQKAIIELKSKDKVVERDDEVFWQQLWKDQNFSVTDVFGTLTAEDVRNIRNESPENFTMLAYKCIDHIRKCVETSCNSGSERQSVLSCIRILTRLVPFFLEDNDFRNFFWSRLPANGPRGNPEYGPHGRFSDGEPNQVLVVDDTTPAAILINSLTALLFCPNFTVAQHKKLTEQAENLNAIDSCEYIWEAGIGFKLSPAQNGGYDLARIEILRLLLACFSETIYTPDVTPQNVTPNRWLELFTSADNRHVLPLFTSLFNVVLSYDPVGYGVPYNYMLFGDTKEPLAETAAQVLLVCLDHNWNRAKLPPRESLYEEETIKKNMFINYLSRIHRDEDLDIIVKGFVRLLNNPLQHSYLPSSTKKIRFHQELLILFWKCCDYNKRIMYHVLKSPAVLDIIVPILHSLNESKQHTGKVGFVHMGIFILLLLSGERNLGVRLNQPFTGRPLMDLPPFNGNHADLLILVFHKLITCGHSKLQPLFECLLTIILNVSAYVKSLSMTTATKLLHLFEAFSTPWFLFANSTNYHLTFLLLETFNNLIQYQFDGNAPLVYAIIRKRGVFHQLANMPIDNAFIRNAARTKKDSPGKASEDPGSSDARSPSESASYHTTLPATPAVMKITGRTTVAEQSENTPRTPGSDLPSVSGSNDDVFEARSDASLKRSESKAEPSRSVSDDQWAPSTEWVQSWRNRLPLHVVMRMLQVLVPQVEKIAIDKNISDEAEILKFLHQGTLVGLLPVPHPIIIQKYQSNAGTSNWIRAYAWGIICIRNKEPAIWFDTKVKLFEIQSSPSEK